MRASDIVSGLVLLAVGLVTLYGVIPAQISSRSFGGVAPDFFPRGIAWLFLALVTLLLVSRIVAVVRAIPSPEPADLPMRGADVLFIAAAAAVLAATYWLMATVGFIAAGIFAVAVVGVAIGGWRRRNLIQVAALGAVAPLLVYLAFRHLFMIYLPA